MRNLLFMFFTFPLFGCDDFGEPAPTFMTVEELELSYDETIGEEVILEGRLSRNSENQYSLVQRLPGIASDDISDFKLQLNFMYDNVDHSQMERCLDDATLVTGFVENARRIRVERVKFTADTRIHRPDNCYVDNQ